MTPTTWRTLLPLALLAGVGGFVLADQAYGSLVTLPGYAPVTALVIALFELGLAKVINDQLRGRSRGKAMHPLQVARAVALAKASSAAGALLLGLYAGFFTWTFPRRDVLAVASHDALVSGLSAAAALLLLVAALVLERVCRAPGPSPDPDEEPD
jgi:hypothetical protein